MAFTVAPICRPATKSVLCVGDGDVVAELAVGEAVFWIEDESSEHDNVSPEALGGATERLRIVVGDPGAVLKQAAPPGGARSARSMSFAGGCLAGWLTPLAIPGTLDGRSGTGHR